MKPNVTAPGGELTHNQTKFKNKQTNKKKPWNHLKSFYKPVSPNIFRAAHFHLLQEQIICFPRFLPYLVLQLVLKWIQCDSQGFWEVGLVL